MKKIILGALIVALLSTSISFASTLERPDDSLKDLSRVEDDISVVVSSILSGKYDVESLKKTLKFDRSILSSVYLNSYNELSTPNLTELQIRKFSSILHIASLFNLSINGIMLYLDNPTLNQTYFLDSISQYRLASVSLKEVINYMKK